MVLYALCATTYKALLSLGRLGPGSSKQKEIGQLFGAAAALLEAPKGAQVQVWFVKVLSCFHSAAHLNTGWRSE